MANPFPQFTAERKAEQKHQAWLEIGAVALCYVVLISVCVWNFLLRAA